MLRTKKPTLFAAFLALFILCVGLGAAPARAGEDGLLWAGCDRDGGEDGREKPVPTAASLRAALLYQPTGAGTGSARAWQVPHGGVRSVPLAFGLSAVVPGLGQAYNKQWLKAAIVVAAEAALITGYAVWHRNGVDGRDAYQFYAQEYWSPVRYAQWLNDYKEWIETDFGTPVPAPLIAIPLEAQGLDLHDWEHWTSAQRSAVRSLFDQIRNMENHVYHPETGASFSHKLPYFGEQQYYELVGKYFQFAPGWADYDFLLDENGNATWIDSNGDFIASIDPEKTGPNGEKVNVSNRFLQYAKDHGQANDYLRRASRLSVLFLATHFVAAVDAALFAKLHNDRVKASLDVGYNAYGEPEPVARLTVKM